MFINKNKKLLRAVEKEMNSEKIQKLINSGADVNIKNEEGQTLLKIINIRIQELKFAIEEANYDDIISSTNFDELSVAEDKYNLRKKGLEFLEEIKEIIIKAGGG